MEYIQKLGKTEETETLTRCSHECKVVQHPEKDMLQTLIKPYTHFFDLEIPFLIIYSEDALNKYKTIFA